MPRISIWFYLVGVLYSLIGMAWGQHMAMTNDHTMMPAHAHLNLLGWVSMAIYGTFYALARDHYSMRLAWIQFALSNIGLVVIIVLLTWLLASNDQSIGPLVGIGVALTFLGQLLFGWQVLRSLRAR